MTLIKILNISKQFFRKTTISFGNFHNSLTLSSSINTVSFHLQDFQGSFEILKLPL